MLCSTCNRRRAERLGKTCNNCHRRNVRASQPAVVPRLRRDDFCEKYTQIVLANPALTNKEVSDLMGISIYGLGRGLARYRASGHLKIMRASNGTSGAYIVSGWRPKEANSEA